MYITRMSGRGLCKPCSPSVSHNSFLSYCLWIREIELILFCERKTSIGRAGFKSKYNVRRQAFYVYRNVLSAQPRCLSVVFLRHPPSGHTFCSGTALSSRCYHKLVTRAKLNNYPKHNKQENVQSHTLSKNLINTII